MSYNPKLILVLTFLFLVIVVASFLPLSPCTTVKTVPASVEIVHNERNYLGFNTDKDSLNFGKVTPKTAVKRSIKVGYSLPARVKVIAETDFSSWLAVEPDNFVVGPENGQEVFFTVTVPEDARSGNYSGTIKFCFRK